MAEHDTAENGPEYRTIRAEPGQIVTETVAAADIERTEVEIKAGGGVEIRLYPTSTEHTGLVAMRDHLIAVRVSLRQATNEAEEAYAHAPNGTEHAVRARRLRDLCAEALALTTYAIDETTTTEAQA